MAVRENEQRRVLEDWEIKDAIRAHLSLSEDAEIIFQIDGTALVVWHST